MMLQHAPQKAELRPTTSFDSTQTGAEQRAPDALLLVSGVATSAAAGASTPLLVQHLAPGVAKQAIKEALAPLGPAQLARVQEQLRQSRLARQQASDACQVGAVAGGTTHAPSSNQHSSSSSTPAGAQQQLHAENDDGSSGGGSGSSSSNPLVQQVAAALARGQLAAQDVKRVLSTLDPSVFLPLPSDQQLQPEQLMQPAWQQHLMMSSAAHHHDSTLSVPAAPAPAAVVMPLSPFDSASQLQLSPPSSVHRSRARRQAPAASVAAPYSAVLSNLQLPPAALAAHAAAAAAAAAADPAAAAAAAQPLHHPGSAARKGLRTGRRPRGQVGSLLRSVSTGSDAAGHTSLFACTGPMHNQQQPLDDTLHMLAAQAGDTQHPAAYYYGPPMLVRPDAAPAAAANSNSLQARFARLSPRVQAVILRELDQLAAGEEELMMMMAAGRGGPAALGMMTPPCEPAELQGPRRSGRARKVRNWEAGGFTSRGNRSTSPTPPFAAEHDAAGQDQDHDQDQHNINSSSAAYYMLHKRMRLDAGSSSRLQHPQSASPDASSARQQRHHHGDSSPGVGYAAVDGEMPPALDLQACCPAAAEPEQQQQPRRRRIPRKAGQRASARKSMHRRTFRRGKPQRAPAM